MTPTLCPCVASATATCTAVVDLPVPPFSLANRSEEHTSELQSLMRISYAVFCLKKKKKIHTTRKTVPIIDLVPSLKINTHNKHHTTTNLTNKCYGKNYIKIRTKKQ